MVPHLCVDCYITEGLLTLAYLSLPFPTTLWCIYLNPTLGHPSGFCPLQSSCLDSAHCGPRLLDHGALPFGLALGITFHPITLRKGFPPFLNSLPISSGNVSP